MKQMMSVGVTVGALAVAGVFTLASLGTTVSAQGAAPAYRVDPFWPQPLANHWVFGSVTGVAVDAQDHLWVLHRGADSLESNEKGMMLTPPTSSICCTAAPFVLELDAAGKVVSSFGGPGQGYHLAHLSRANIARVHFPDQRVRATGEVEIHQNDQHP